MNCFHFMLCLFYHIYLLFFFFFFLRDEVDPKNSDMERSLRHSEMKKQVIGRHLYSNFKLYVVVRMCLLLYICICTYMFSSILGKKRAETKTSVWYEGYVCHKLMCFQFFMPEVIIMETILKHRYINFNNY